MQKLLDDHLNLTLHQSSVSTFAMEPVGIWQLMHSSSLAELHFLPVLVVKMLNKDAPKG